MDSKSFINWKMVAGKMGKNFNINTHAEKVLWNEVKIVKVCKNEPDYILYKTNYEENEYKKIFIREKVRSKKQPITLNPCYEGNVTISEKKKQDLIQLCNDEQIPRIHHDFFKNLTVVEPKRKATSESDSDEN